MDKNRGLQALDDDALDAVTGGVELRTAEAKDVTDTVRQNLFRGEDNSDIWDRVIGILWDR